MVFCFFFFASGANVCRFLASDRFAFSGPCPRGAAVTLDFTVADRSKGSKKVRYVKLIVYWRIQLLSRAGDIGA